MIKPSSLIIAGSDSGAGAGMQADLKTFSAHKIYAATVITAITAQNTIGVDEVMDIPTKMIEAQLKSINDDFNISIIKIGMLSRIETIEVISYCIKKYFSKIPIVLDPVMVAKGGHALLDLNSIECLKKELLPKCFLITPNLPEAENLLGIKIKSSEDMKINIENFKSLNINNALLKGGHLNENKITDLLYTKKKVYRFTSKKINTMNTHGTGCTLASAITCNLFKKFSLPKSVSNARDFVIRGIKKASIIGNGHNPLHHFL